MPCLAEHGSLPLCLPATPQAIITKDEGGHNCSVLCLTISGQHMFSGDQRGNIIVWDLATGTSPQKLPGAHGDMPVMAMLVFEVRTAVFLHYSLSCSPSLNLGNPLSGKGSAGSADALPLTPASPSCPSNHACV
jgi:hypothetical protein